MAGTKIMAGGTSPFKSGSAQEYGDGPNGAVTQDGEESPKAFDSQNDYPPIEPVFAPSVITSGSGQNQGGTESGPKSGIRHRLMNSALDMKTKVPKSSQDGWG